MKHSSVFINDADEAGRLIKEMPSKGSIYAAFRYDANVPDLLGERNAEDCLSYFIKTVFPLSRTFLQLLSKNEVYGALHHNFVHCKSLYHPFY
jgi:hypothetical protein